MTEKTIQTFVALSQRNPADVPLVIEAPDVSDAQNQLLAEMERLGFVASKKNIYKVVAVRSNGETLTWTLLQARRVTKKR